MKTFAAVSKMFIKDPRMDSLAGRELLYFRFRGHPGGAMETSSQDFALETACGRGTGSPESCPSEGL